MCEKAYFGKTQRKKQIFAGFSINFASFYILNAMYLDVANSPIPTNLKTSCTDEKCNVNHI